MDYLSLCCDPVNSTVAPFGPAPPQYSDAGSKASWSCYDVPWEGHDAIVALSEATESSCVDGEWSKPACQVLPDPSSSVQFLHWIHIELTLPDFCYIEGDTPELYDDTYWCAGVFVCIDMVCMPRY
jgi:hypothetical protein